MHHTHSHVERPHGDLHDVLLRQQLHNQLLLTMHPVPVLPLKLAKPGVELVLSSLAKLPYDQAAGLIREIEAQANYQLEMLQRTAEAAKASEATNPSPAVEQAPSASSDPVPATAN